MRSGRGTRHAASEPIFQAHAMDYTAVAPLLRRRVRAAAEHSRPFRFDPALVEKGMRKDVLLRAARVVTGLMVRASAKPTTSRRRRVPTRPADADAPEDVDQTPPGAWCVR